MSRRLAVLLAALIACGGSQPKTAPPPPPPPPPVDVAKPAPPPSDPDAVPLPLWPEVHQGKLSNGLTYFIMKHGKPEHRAMLWLAVNAGSVQEDDDQRGLAHFDEHMAFNGTKRFPKNELVNYLEKIGMRFGADLNAYTTWDQTVYQLEVPTDKPEFVGKGLDILRDWAGDVSYDPVEVDKERGVVLEEWRLGRGAGTRLFDKQAKVLFKGSRYADRITIGDPEIIKHAKRDTLYRFYKDWYRPDEMAVIAVGDFDPATLEKEIQARFGNLVPPAKERPRPSGGVPAATGTRVSIETDKEAMGTTVNVVNLIPHRPAQSKKDYRRLVGEVLYAEILNERLASIARKPDAPFVVAQGGMQSLVRDIDGFDRIAQVKNGKVEDALRELFTEVIRMERHGITPGELERARANNLRFISEAAEQEATTDSRDFTDEITRYFFAQELMIGRVGERDLTKELLPTITVDDLNALAKKFGGAENRVIMISAPEGAKAPKLPSNERVLQIVDEVQKAQVDPWHEDTVAAKFMDKPPVAGKIVKETKNDKVGTTEWTLSNGARVIVKPTDFEADSIELEGYSPGGEATAKDKDWASDRFADDVASVGGLGDIDSETLGKMLAGKQVEVGTQIDESIEAVTAKASAHDLDTMMQLVYLKMTAPRKDPQAFGVWKANLAQQLENLQNNPEFQFGRQAFTAEWKNNLRRRLPEAADIPKIDLDKALAFYKDRFGDATDFTFVFVGAVDVAKLKPLVETYLASLPAKGRHEKEKDLGIRKATGIVKKEWKMGAEPKATVRIDFHGEETWSRDKDRDMFILGQVLSIKLREQMREEKGGVYGVHSAGFIARSPHQARSFTINFGCDPTRVDELVKTAFEEIGKLQKDGAQPDDLAKVKETYVRARETELRQNSFWVDWLAKSSRYGDDPAIVLDTGPVVARMTSDNVKAAAKRYLDAKQYFQAVLLPEGTTSSPVPPAKPAK
jgi:zinc protease